MGVTRHTVLTVSVHQEKVDAANALETRVHHTACLSNTQAGHLEHTLLATG